MKGEREEQKWIEGGRGSAPDPVSEVLLCILKKITVTLSKVFQSIGN